MNIKEIETCLKNMGNPETAKQLQRFFKTGPGEYGHGDIFIGVRVPQLRKLIKKYKTINYNPVQKLLISRIHEHRMMALLILVREYSKGNQSEKEEIYKLYIKNIRYVNNWDIVDCSAQHIVGAFLKDKDKKQLYDFANSKNLWKRRISIIATFHYIKLNEFSETFRIAKVLLTDKEDLIHKATGWMLREIGKRDLQVLENFLKKYYRNMPRTMLRYAIEKFPEPQRQKYLNR
jgi:3-methyladenine DNA glycosylase AlkD